MKTFTADYLQEHWANGKKITLKGKKYRVGKMSYGDYFLEYGQERGETEPFNKGTKWLKKTEKNPYFYEIIAI
jgi:hypothetical protein